MVVRKFQDDKKHKITRLHAYLYRNISDEMSSEEQVTKDITSFVLSLLYENTMFYNNCRTNVTATCADEDEYDPEIGREICNAKADLKYHKKMYDRYLKVAWVLRRVSNRLMEYVELHQRKIERLESDLDQYQK